MEDLKFFTLPLQGLEGTITYVISEVIEYPDGKIKALLMHPLAPGILIPLPANSKDQLESNQMQTTGRCNLQMYIEYANKKKDYLDYNMKIDVESLCVAFVVNRNLSPKQKKRLANINGIISSIYFNNDVQLAMRFVDENYILLDDFNKSWYETIKGYLSQSNIRGLPRNLSPKQRPVIFNIAGFILSQLEG